MYFSYSKFHLLSRHQFYCWFIQILRFRIKNKYQIINDFISQTNISSANIIETTTPQTAGSIECINSQTNIIMAHKSNIRFMVLSQDGQFIATCSEKGTLIRIYNTNTKKLIKELRRGTDEATINWLCFNKDNTKLLCNRSKRYNSYISHQL